MTETRSSDRQNGANDNVQTGEKRKPETEPSPARDSKATKKQATIEETMSKESDKNDQMEDVKEEEHQEDTHEEAKTSKSEPDSDGKEEASADQNAIEESSQRKGEVPSNVLEKGIIYFFTRNRVGIEDADSVGDIQRTFFVLRPLPLGAKLSDGAIPDEKTNRLLALPKKTFPKSHSDRFMAFVEKANTSVQELKDDFFAANEYETKTQGTRRTEPVTPIAEGVYAITRTEDATTHLVYATTIPTELGELQEDFGIREQGSFIISVKNPERSGPAQAQLPQKPDFPKEIIDGFRNLVWSEVKPKHLDYEYCQILLIGEKVESGVEPTKKDQKHDKQTPLEEIEKLEHEDELRVEHLHGK